MLELESIKIMVPLLMITSLILNACVWFTKFGHTKGFIFLTGGFCMATATAYGFQAILDTNKLISTAMIIWFVLTLIVFATAVWLLDE